MNQDNRNCLENEIMEDSADRQPSTQPAIILSLDEMLEQFLPFATTSQETLFKLYIGPLVQMQKPPPNILLTVGAAGTGKTVLINAISAAIESLQCHVIRTAYNNINANDIHGQTTASLVNTRVARLESEAAELENFSNVTGLTQTSAVKLLIIDEISTQSPIYLAKLSHACQQIRHNMDEPFGGIPVLLIGDLGQLPPVKAPALYMAAMEVAMLVDHPRRELSRRP